MSEKNLEIAVAYYQAINNKDPETAGAYLHPDVKLISPLAILSGKDSVLEALRGFTQRCNKVVIRAQFGSDNQVMLALDVEFPAPIGNLRAAVLMTFKDNLIQVNEMFYDGRQVITEKEAIFSKS